MKKKFYNIDVDHVSQEQALETCREIIRGNRLRSLFFLNAHCFNIAQKNKRYRDALNRSDLVLNDGIGLKLGGYLAGIRFSENLNGTDLIPKIIEMGAADNKKFYFVGSTGETVRKTKEVLENKFPAIRITGICHGFFGEQDDRDIIDELNRTGTDILIAGMGVPRQELWIEKIRSELKTVKLCVAGGAIIDFISGRIERAPLWMQRANIEWVFRLLIEPKRMWKRYLVGNLEFFLHVFRLYFKGKNGRSRVLTNQPGSFDAKYL